MGSFRDRVSLESEGGAGDSKSVVAHDGGCNWVRRKNFPFGKDNVPMEFEDRRQLRDWVGRAALQSRPA